MPDLLDDQRFYDLLGLFQDRAVPRDEFERMPMPAGLPASEVWETIRRIRRAQGVVYGDPSSQDGMPLTQWYTPTRTIELALRDLADRTRTGSALDVALRERSGRRLVTEPLIQEVVSAVWCESLSVDAPSVRAVALREREPSTPAERLARNMFDVLDRSLDERRAQTFDTDGAVGAPNGADPNGSLNPLIAAARRAHATGRAGSDATLLDGARGFDPPDGGEAGCPRRDAGGTCGPQAGAPDMPGASVSSFPHRPASASPITRPYIEDLHARLLEGLDADAFTSSIPWGLEWPEDHLDRDELLDQICELAGGRMADPLEHPICLAQRIICKFWKNKPFRSCNYILGSLVASRYLHLAGYPVFTYVPSSTLTLAWRDGTFTAEGVAPYDRCGDSGPADRDWTLYWESNLRILQRDLDGFEHHIMGVKAIDDAVIAAVRADRNLSHRQADVLVKAVLVPETVFKIAEHQRAYDLAYSTARADLTSLADRGLLKAAYEGKTQIFSAPPNLPGELALHYDLKELWSD